MATVTSHKRLTSQTPPTADPVARPESSEPSAEELRALLAEQQAQIAALTQQQAQMAAVIQQLTQPMETPVELVEAAPVEDAASGTGEAEASETPVARKATSRRGLLKWGGLGAAAAVAAAGAAGLGKTVAHAADGDNWVLGASNNASSQTSLNTSASTGLDLNDFTDNANVVVIAGPNGASANGVYSSVGTSANGVQGLAAGTAGYGVWGNVSSGYGVVAESGTGISLWVAGSGRLLLEEQSFSGPPTSGNYSAGEMIRDDIGDMYICVTSGSPGRWLIVGAATPGFGGAAHLLSNPIRLLDTTTGSPWNGGSVHTVQITGVSVGGVQVPNSAVGVIGNVTVLNPTTNGHLTLYPGSSAPLASTIYYSPTVSPISNAVIVGLNSSGQLNFQVTQSSGNTDVRFDASGYIR
ncbi:MAG TPA: hypothetical protein VKQ36_00140 [Ktedonobacterales bacterium]|nr:hypothetical protein [Ktedonobacterales bacterium]